MKNRSINSGTYAGIAIHLSTYACLRLPLALLRMAARKETRRRWAMATMSACLALIAGSLAAESVRIYPSPAGEPLATNFSVTIGRQSVPVYIAQVAALGTAKQSGMFIPYDTAFASFDLQGSVTVSVTCPEAVIRANILPNSSGVTPTISGHTLTFTVSKPCQLEVEVNGDWMHSLQFFVNPIETNAPRPDDPDVIYFGPGVHQVEDLQVGSGKTVYIAGGAVVYGKVKPDVNSRHNVSAISELGGGAVFSLAGDNIKICGRGIIDGSLCPNHTRNLISVCGTNISLEGVIVRDSSTWTIPIHSSEHETVENIKVFGYRGNSDGIDICNSRHVIVSGCFLRTMDDLVVVKTPVKGAGESRDITVSGCVLWNELAQALNIGAELRENVEDVTFSDCDIIHDKGREWLLRVYNCDDADVHNVTFDNIRIGESKRLISLWIGKAKWSSDNERGHIDNITFQNIRAVGLHPSSDLNGFDAQHEIDDVVFKNIVINGQPLTPANVHQNAFVHGIQMTP
jgi:hypothetical protein